LGDDEEGLGFDADAALNLTSFQGN